MGVGGLDGCKVGRHGVRRIWGGWPWGWGDMGSVATAFWGYRVTGHGIRGLWDGWLWGQGGYRVGGHGAGWL